MNIVKKKYYAASWFALDIKINMLMYLETNQAKIYTLYVESRQNRTIEKNEFQYVIGNRNDNVTYYC